jgi:hypothetical protein
LYALLISSMSRPSYPLWFDHPNMWWRVHVMKLMQCYALKAIRGVNWSLPEPKNICTERMMQPGRSSNVEQACLIAGKSCLDTLI